MTIKVYGASDDLIEIEGDINEEFAYNDPERWGGSGSYLAFGDGTILDVQYRERGVWRIVVVCLGENSVVTVHQAPEDDDSNYSDVAELHAEAAPIRWVVYGSEKVLVKGAAHATIAG